MPTPLLLAVCLAAADRPMSVRAPLPAGGESSRVLRDDERDALVPTRSATAAALASQAAGAFNARGEPIHDPGSLFAVQDPEPRAFAVHDLVTIVVSESSRAKSVADARADKQYEMSAAVDAWISMDPTSFGSGFGAPLDATSLPAVGATADKTFRGRGNYSRTDDFTARVTAEIVEVRPNGLLVLEARREIVNDGETQVIVLSGVCRPEDVDGSNQVLSQRVADAVVKKTTTGQLRDTSEKGVLAKLLDAIFAF
jgi:flagellar L-ring protein precursor FlgH